MKVLSESLAIRQSTTLTLFANTIDQSLFLNNVINLAVSNCIFNTTAASSDGEIAS